MRKANSQYRQAYTVECRAEEFDCPTCAERVEVGGTAWVEEDDGPHCSAYCAGWAPTPYFTYLKLQGEQVRAERLAK